VLQAFRIVWQLRPAIEDSFWILSVFLKVGTFGVFYVVVLADLYSQKVVANNLFVENLGKGIVVVDEDFNIVNANDLAGTLVNLPATFLRNKNARQVLFRSLVESEAVLDAMRSGSRTEEVTISVKYFVAGVSGLENIQGVRRILSAYPLGKDPSGKGSGLFVIGGEA